MNNQNLFSQTYDQLKQQIGQGNANFQMLGNPIDFSWPVAPNGQTSLQAYQLMSIMPQWSPVGVYGSTGATLFDAYRQVMAGISTPVNPEKQQALTELKNQLTNANNDLQQIVSNQNSAYEVAKQNGGAIFEAQYPTILDWLNGPGSTYTVQIEKQTVTVNKLTENYTTLMADVSINPALKEDFELIKTPTTPVSGAAPTGWTKVARTDSVLEWEPAFNIGTTGQSWRNQLTGGSIGAFSINLNASNSQSSLNNTWAGGSASYNSFFWGVKGSGGWNRTDFTQSDKSVTVEINVKSSTHVPVTPGKWFDGGLMRSLYLGNSSTGAKLTEPKDKVFGKSGLLSTQITGFLVVYKPSYTITMKSSTYSKYEQTIKAGGGLRIGPFTFGGNGGSHTVNIKQTGNSTVLTGESTSDDPLIIGMTVAFPGVTDTVGTTAEATMQA